MKNNSSKISSLAISIVCATMLGACGESNIEKCTQAFNEGEYELAVEKCEKEDAVTEPDALYILGRIKKDDLGGLGRETDAGNEYLYRFILVPNLDLSIYPHAVDVMKELASDEEYFKNNKPKATQVLKLFEKVAKDPQHKSSANFRAIANAYINLLSDNPDYEKAWEYLDMASQMKDLDAMYYQAKIYMLDLVEKTPEKTKAFQNILEQRSRAGVSSVDELREYAKSVLEDSRSDAETIEYGKTILKELAVNDDPESALIIGSISLKNGDEKEAKKWLIKAHKAGSSLAALQLSDIYFDEGRNDDAIEILKELASKDNQAARFKLALVDLGHHRNDPPSEEEIARGISFIEGLASRDLAEVSEKNQDYQAIIAARRILASIYIYGGFGREKNIKKAEELLLSLIDKSAESEDELAHIYSMNDSELFDNAKALAMFEKSITHGMEENNLTVGSMYLHGIGTDKNYEKAMRIFTKAVDSGVVDAYNDLGNIYLNGLGVDKDPVKAEELYRKSASSGNHVALYNLAILKASQDNYVDAYAWGAAYASCGYTDGRMKLKYYLKMAGKKSRQEAIESSRKLIEEYGCKPKEEEKQKNARWWENP